MTEVMEMMTFTKWLLGATALLTFAGIYLVGMVKTTPTRASEAEAAQLPLSRLGPHPVGMRTLPATTTQSIALTVWYPADPSGAGEAVTYRYQLKMARLLGATTIGTYRGHAIPDASPALSSGPYPLVVMPPGFATGHRTYGWLAEHLASYGFAVVSYEHDEALTSAMNQLWRSTVVRPRTLNEVLDRLTHQARPGGSLAGVVDMKTVAVVGHSFGGYTALVAGGARLAPAEFRSHCAASASDDPGAWLCDVVVPHLDEMEELAHVDPDDSWPDWSHGNVAAVVSLAGDAYLFGETGLASLTTPLLAIGGTADTDTPYRWGTQPTYEHSSSPRKIRLTLHGAEHMIFTAQCDRIRRIMKLVPNGFCNDTSWNRGRAHQLVKHYTTAFLLAELQHDEPAARLLEARVGLPDVTYDVEGYSP